jgi:hypothetical protein
MPIAFTTLHFSWFRLAAFVGASLVTADASAACPSMPARGEFRPARCCKSSGSVTPRSATPTPATVRRALPIRSGGICPNAARCCYCGPHAPPAPEPKGQRASESRPDPGRITEAGWLDLGGVFPPFIGPVPATGSTTQTSPLYLLNSRLLI